MRGQKTAQAHVVRSKERKDARKERRIREWSSDRPVAKDADMSVIEQASMLLQGGTGFEQADKTGLCTSTIYRFRNGKVYEPRFRTLQMIAKANGGRMVFVKDN